MGDNFNVIWSAFIAIVFAYGAFQTWNGDTKFVGKSVENVKPEFRAAYCKEMSYPMFMLAGVEVVDVIIQLTVDLGMKSLLLLGAGIIVGIIWIVAVQKKYSKM